MSFTLKGKLTDDHSQPYSNYTVKAFHKEPIFDIFGDEPVGSAVTLDDGTFRIDFTKSLIWANNDQPKIYLKVSDTSGVVWANNDQPKIYLKVFDTSGVNIHETVVIDPNFVAFNNSNEVNQCEAVVVFEPRRSK